MTIAQYLRYSDLYGSKVHFQSLQKKLRNLRGTSVITNLSVINAKFAFNQFFENFEIEFPKLQKELNDNYLRVSLRADIHNGNKQNNSVFSRLHTLFLSQLCILNCNENSNNLADGKTEGGYSLGDCFLMSGDYLISSKEEKSIQTGTNKKIIKHLGFQLAPLWELQSPLDFQQGIVRSEIIYSQILNSNEFRQILIEEKLSDFDISVAFHKATKISLVEYVDITLAILFTLLLPENEGLENAQYFTSEGFLRYSNFEVNDFKRYLKLEAKSMEKFKNQFKIEKRYLKQFKYILFKQHALIEILNDLYICVDLFFLSEKLNSGIYWKIFDSLPTDKKEVFFVVYGYIFELYVRHILKKITSKNEYFINKGLLFSSPKYQNGEKSFDEIIYYPETKHLIVIECKSSFMHTEAKYGHSVQKFQREIKRKFVAKENATDKGVGQLANHIARIFHNDKSKRLSFDDSDLNFWIQNAEKVSPVLITQETIISFHINEEMLNVEMNKRLRRERIKESISLSQLTVIDISTLEKLKPFFVNNQLTLEQCINLRAYRDSKYKWHFQDFIFTHFPMFEVEDKESSDIYNLVLERIQQRFFADKSETTI